MIDALNLAFAAMRFEAVSFRSVLTDADAARQAWIVLLLSAMMLAASQSVVLFANRVPPLRFLLTLLVSGVRYAAVAISFSVAFVLAGRIVGLPDAPVSTILPLVALGWAPGILSLFSIVPHFGLGWQRIIEAWIAALMVTGLAIGMGLPPWQAVLIGVAGWLLGQIAGLFIGPLLARMNWRLLEVAAGRDLLREADPVAVLRAQAANPAALRAGP